MRLGAILALAGAAAVARGDGLPQAALPDAQAVNLRSPLEALPTVDRVVVHKSERRLVLMHGGNVVRAYHVQLGLAPVGQKERSGDFRTPEGTYRLERRNPRSDYFLSIQVSYPNAGDLRRAHKRHWETGGSIMIHGLPNQPQPRHRLLREPRLDRRLHRRVQRRHGGDLDAHPRRRADRHPALASEHATIQSSSTRASGRAAVSRTCPRARSTSCSTPGRAACTRCSAAARWRC